MNLVRVLLFFSELVISILLRGALAKRNARRARRLLENLGGLWIKLGQLISLRRDLLPAVYAMELSNLQDNAKGFPTEEAIGIIEAEFGCPIDDLFSDFELVPIGAASIAQVHRARLKYRNIAVAIKVRRPSVDRQFRRSLRWIRMLTDVMARLDLAPHFQWREMYSEFQQTALEELDFRIEAASLGRMRKQLREDKITVPKPFHRYTTQRVLVMEFVDGVFMSDYIDMLGKDPERAEQWCLENEIDPTKVSKRLYLSMMRQLFRFNLFHADMHPGNIMLLRKNRVALIDFGSVGFLDAEFLRNYRYFLESIAERDYSGAADLLFLLSNALPEGDLTDTRAAIVASFRAWETRANTIGLPYHEKSLTNAVSEIFLTLSRKRISLSWAFLRMDRAELTLDASLVHLDPDRNYAALLRKHFRRVTTEKIAAELEPERLQDNFGRFVLGALDLARNLEEEHFHLSRQVRQSVQVFRATTTKAADFMVATMRAVSFALGALGIYLYVLMLWKWEQPFLVEFLESEPPLATSTPDPLSLLWIVYLAVVAFAFRESARMARRFGERGRDPIRR